MPSAEVLQVLSGISSFFGLIAVLAYYLLHAKSQRVEQSIAEQIEGEPLFNAKQILDIIGKFETDEGRIKALKHVGRFGQERAEAFLTKVKDNVDLTGLAKLSVGHSRQITATLAVVFIVFAVVAYFYARHIDPPLAKITSVDVTSETTAANWERATRPMADRRVETTVDRICAVPQDGYQVDTTRAGFHGGLAVANSTGDNGHREFWDGDCFVITATWNNGRGSHSDATGIAVALKKLLPVGPCGSDVKKGIREERYVHRLQ